jgi:hypothetical protein
VPTAINPDSQKIVTGASTMKSLNDLAALRGGTCAAATKFFAACRKKVKNARWIGLAVLPDDDVQSAYLMADHRAAADKRAKRLQAAEGLTDLPPEIDEEMFHFMLRLDGVPDWASNEYRPADLNKPLAAIWDAFEKSGKSTGQKALRKKCLQAMVEGLQDFERRSKLGKLVVRDDFLLLVIFPDPDEPKEVRAMTKQLNPPSLYKRFAKAYQMSDE